MVQTAWQDYQDAVRVAGVASLPKRIYALIMQGHGEEHSEVDAYLYGASGTCAPFAETLRLAADVHQERSDRLSDAVARLTCATATVDAILDDGSTHGAHQEEARFLHRGIAAVMAVARRERRIAQRFAGFLV